MKKIAVIVKGYPRLSETFIAQEILALEQAGVDICIYSLRHPTDHTTHPLHQQIQADINYLPEYLYQEPVRVFKALFNALFKKNFFPAFKQFIRDLSRDRTINRIRRFGQALVLSNELAADRQWLYAHFLHTPASVGQYSAILSQLPWSCSAHAKDIWTSPKWECREKIAQMQWLVTCTKANTEYLKSISATPEKVTLLYHGLDLSRFPSPVKQQQNDGRDEHNQVNILSVGRAVNKKGYDVLLTSLAQLPKDLHWTFTHIGGGSLLKPLQQAAEQLGINDRIVWRGAQNSEQVIEAYQNSDVFVLASRIDENGDRDGLPNVLMEAMSQKLCCLSTDISGIPELIQNNHSGLLVAAEDAEQLSQALAKLIKQPKLRATLAENGHQTLVSQFSLQNNIQQLIERFKIC